MLIVGDEGAVSSDENVDRWWLGYEFINMWFGKYTFKWVESCWSAGCWVAMKYKTHSSCWSVSS